MNAEGPGIGLQRVSVLTVSEADQTFSLLLQDYYTERANNLKEVYQLGGQGVRIALLQTLNASTNFTSLQS